MKLRLLFTGGGGSGNEAIYNLLSEKYDMYFADADITAINPIIPKSNALSIPLADSPDFVEAISTICNDEKIDLLILGVDEELYYRDQIAEKISVVTKLFCPSQSVINLMLDKYELMMFLTSNRLTAPETILYSDEHKLEYPLILKPRKGRGSRGVYLVYNREELMCYRLLSKVTDNDLVLQEYAQGQEYTVMLVSDINNVLQAVVPVRVDIKKGITIKAEIVKNDKIINYCKTIHKLINGSGIYNIQLIETISGDIMPFEINPRISTTSCMSIVAGIDLFEVFLSAGQDNTKLLPFKTAVKLNRHWVNCFEP